MLEKPGDVLTMEELSACLEMRSNTVDGLERRTDAEFAYFLAMAKGSGSEHPNYNDTLERVTAAEKREVLETPSLAVKKLPAPC
ncbi:MAG: hypothetical protein KatS3mg081_1719 [Gemmatimonadales bacterium]|nr:MAG: hypothetical protein KatS3mg081_1719 [Gemmatimonadales bacterium]